LLLLVDEPVTEKPETQEENDEARVKDEAEAEKAPKTKTVYDWELMNTANQFGHVNHQMLLKTNKPTSTKA
jgi:hypothetical protein